MSKRMITTVALGATLLCTASVQAQQLQSTTRAAPPEPAPAPAIDAAAMDALNRMGAYLRTLSAFQVRAEVTTEEVLLDGQKVQLGSVADLVAKAPNGLRLDVTTDKARRLFLYDGTTFTLFAPRSSYYASFAAPPTIRELMDLLETKHGIELPFTDLFRWGTPASNAKDITGATDIGPSDIEGVTCEHYAFRQDGLDWQLWIQRGDFPLPRKLVITTLTDEARPQHVSVYTWNLAPSLDGTTFVFDPPDDARKIPLAELPAGDRLIKPKEPKP
jgi:hypothetical protein